MNRYKAHQVLIKKAKLRITSEIKEMRIFDHTVGLFYTKNAVPVKVGVNGMSDCFGLITTDKGLVYVALEFKSGNARQSKDQIQWQEFIESRGGLYIVVRDDLDEAINKLKDYIRNL